MHSTCDIHNNTGSLTIYCMESYEEWIRKSILNYLLVAIWKELLIANHFLRLLLLFITHFSSRSLSIYRLIVFIAVAAAAAISNQTIVNQLNRVVYTT